MIKEAIIWGSSGHGKVVLDILAQNGTALAATVDRNPDAKPLLDGAPCIIGKSALLTWLQDRDIGALEAYIAIGGPNGSDRLEILHFLGSLGIEVPNLVHPLSNQSPSARIGASNQFLAFSNIAADCEVGQGCIFNHRASIDHECVIGDGVHVAPGATLCGIVKVERGAFVGAGSVILPRVQIGANAVIGAGSVVTKNVPANTVVAGNPAKPIRIEQKDLET